MSTEDKELEIKLLISDLPFLQEQLKGKNVQLVQDRTYEINLRFDDHKGTLTNSKKVLRLRQDTLARLTYKGPSKLAGGATLRQEIEFSVSDFEAARHFLEALGYRVVMVYEKFRTTYRLSNVLITLDEMPYGGFIELEGSRADDIQQVTHELGLNWEARIPESYTSLFEKLRTALNLTFRDLTFENFAGLSVPLSVLNLKFADRD